MANANQDKVCIYLANPHTFARQVTLLPGTHEFIKRPHPNFPTIMWLVWEPGLAQSQIIGMSESAWHTLAEHSHGRIVIDHPAISAAA